MGKTAKAEKLDWAVSWLSSTAQCFAESHLQFQAGFTFAFFQDHHVLDCSDYYFSQFETFFVNFALHFVYSTAFQTDYLGYLMSLEFLPVGS